MKMIKRGIIIVSAVGIVLGVIESIGGILTLMASPFASPEWLAGKALLTGGEMQALSSAAAGGVALWWLSREYEEGEGDGTASGAS